MTENDPLARLPKVPAFDVSSTNVAPDHVLKLAQRSRHFGVEGGQDRSPHLTWSGAPEATKSYVVTVYDPDAPTGSGFWHWVVTDIPANVTTLLEGAGTNEGSLLPARARQFPNDAGMRHYLGAAPPQGHGRHRYYVTVNALNIDHLDVPDTATPAFIGFALTDHIVGRAVLVATADAED